MKLYYIGPIDRLLGETVRYGIVYETLTSAKKALSSCVRESRNDARQRGYGMVYSHWNTDRMFCRLTLRKDERSALWEQLAVMVCRSGVWYEEKVK